MPNAASFIYPDISNERPKSEIRNLKLNENLKSNINLNPDTRPLTPDKNLKSEIRNLKSNKSIAGRLRIYAHETAELEALLYEVMYIK